jgi:hypothetical protein
MLGLVGPIRLHLPNICLYYNSVVCLSYILTIIIVVNALFAIAVNNVLSQ